MQHQEKMKHSYKRLKCGKKLVLIDSLGGTRVSGTRLQLYTGEIFTYGMNECAANDMEIIEGI